MNDEDFYIGKQFAHEYPPEAAVWANDHHAVLVQHNDRGVRVYRIESAPAPTPGELAQVRIAELQGMLSETDYLAIKLAEGRVTREEISPMLEKREAWRQEIRELEKMNGSHDA